MTKVQYPFPVHYIKRSDGCDIAYMDEGKGDKTLVFIHGLALYSASWGTNINYLKQHYRCIALDLPGNGLSGKGNYPYGIGYFAESVYQLIQQLQLKNVCLVGHSMGGQTALRLTINHPEAIERLVLCAPAGFETFNPFQLSLYKNSIMFFDYFSSEENSLKNVIKTSFYKYPEFIDGMTEQLISLMHNAQSKQEYRKMIEACVDGMLHEPVYHELNKIKQPVLIIYGERDALIPNRLVNPYTTRHVAEEGLRQLSNAELIMIPKCGHFLQIEKAPEVNSYILNFLRKV
jgi:pimeloyl-ACP methyl ester carboxylesterase